MATAIMSSMRVKPARAVRVAGLSCGALVAGSVSASMDRSSGGASRLAGLKGLKDALRQFFGIADSSTLVLALFGCTQKVFEA
ncbi:hypothetical protein [Melaminivora sp.]